jgi:hypothetical protein
MGVATQEVAHSALFRFETHFHWKLRHHNVRGEWFNWRGKVIKMVEAALDKRRWREELRLPEIEPEEDFWVGSPLYAGNPNYPEYQLPAPSQEQPQ